MTAIKQERLEFLEEKRKRHELSRQTAALFLIGGIDLAKALQTTGAERAALVQRLKRLIERERLKGVRGHWSYDLNRHIALKQGLERLAPETPCPARRKSTHPPAAISLGARSVPRIPGNA
ncbi:cytoplasmic protein [Nitratireductor aquibiodomus]|uniref:cytoplasmic protein n=1 Tax=Nitratireductor aquibiodomus TaxID=204799 RepID=UPI001FEEF377|nr:cytoplasmic protein [Nitratireductor aquibiodomus]